MDKLDLDNLVKSIGGRFKLTCLIQRRMRELQRGHPPLIDDVEGKGWMEIATEEVARGKIRIVFGERAKSLRDLRKKGAPLVKKGEEEK